MELEKTNVDGLLAEGWSVPEIFSAKSRGGQTDIWRVIIKSSNFNLIKDWITMAAINYWE
jgi:hypothetical protein